MLLGKQAKLLMNKIEAITQKVILEIMNIEEHATQFFSTW
jgi:hypothetical protein